MFLVKYRQIVLIFALLWTAVLYRVFFHAVKNFFLFHNIIEICSPKWKTKKLKAKKYYQTDKEKLQERSQKY